MSANHHIKLPFRQSHAFIIGINAYRHITPLRTAVNDAKGLAERLEKQHGYTVHGPLLNPTKDQMLEYLQKTLPEIVGEKDRVVFYFAGHGIALDSDTGPNGYLVPADARQGKPETLIPMDELHQTLSELLCNHGLLIMDCCFSGAFKWSSGYRDVVRPMPRIIYEERFWRYVKDPAWQVITSSAYDQKAVDVISNQSLGMREEHGGEHSPFAYALFEALEGKGDVIPADTGDGVITASELYAYLRDVVETETTSKVKRQSPSMFNLARHDKGEFIFLHPNHRLNLPPRPKRNPFMGLASYNEADSHLFFGRDRVIDALEEKVNRCPLVVVSGASGTGKSSVIKAGLLPRLRKKGYQILPVIRPGKEPMQTLADEIPESTIQTKTKSACILLIDQYEELITQCINPQDRLAFEKQLTKWLKDFPHLTIIISIRSDFEPQFESEILEKWWSSGRYLVPPFSLEEIREVITKPAAQSVLFYEPEEMVDRIEEEVSHSPGALPLLSFALSELYEAYIKSGREDRALTIEDYQAMGGVIGSLRTRAEEIYTQLPPKSQLSMRGLLLRMLSLEGGELSANRLSEEELLFHSPDESQRVDEIAESLVQARLITKGRDRKGHIYIEPAHDALIRSWSRLWKWIRIIGEDQLLLRKQLREAANQYAKEEKIELDKKELLVSPSLLWDKSPYLDSLKENWEKDKNRFNSIETRFILASWELRQDIIENLKRERDHAISIGLSAKSLQLQNEDTTRAIRLAQVAYNYISPPTSESAEALMRIFYSTAKNPLYQSSFSGHRSYINTISIAPDEKSVLTSSSDHTARIWDLNGCELHRLESHTAPVEVAIFSPDGTYIYTGGRDNSIRQWKVDGTFVKTICEQSSGILSLAISSDGRYLISGNADETVSLHDFKADNSHTYSRHAAAVMAVAFLPHSTHFLTGSRDTTVRLWNIDGREELCLTGHRDAILTLDVSPDGNYILTGSSDHTARIWNRSGEMLHTLLGHTDMVNSAIFLPDGKSIITASADGTSILWDLDGKKRQQLRRHQTAITALDYLPSSQQIITADEECRMFTWSDETAHLPAFWHPDIVWALDYSDVHDCSSREDVENGCLLSGCEDGIARIWNMAAQEVMQLVGHKGAVNAVAFDRKGQFLLTGGEDKTARLWNSSGKEVACLQGHNSAVHQVAFSPNNETLLSCSYDGSVRLWTINGQAIQHLQLSESDISKAVFCNQGSTVLTLVKEPIIYLWDTVTATIKKSLIVETPAIAVAVSPDGKRWLTAHKNNVVKLWSAEGELLQRFIGHRKTVLSLAFSPDSQFIVTGSTDFHTRIWDLHGRLILTFDVQESFVRDLVFSANGRFLLAATGERICQWWMAAKINEWLEIASIHALTQQEKKRFGINLQE